MSKARQNKKAQPRSKKQTQKKGVDFPNVAPASRMERNRSIPTTVRVCGNTIPVINGKAAEADPKKLRARKKAALKQRGLKEDETRIET